MVFINISADISRGIWLQLGGERHSSAAPSLWAAPMPREARVTAGRASAAGAEALGGLFSTRRVKSLACGVQI